LTLDNNRLQEQVIKPLRDSILHLSDANDIKMSELQEKVNALEKDKNALNKTIDKLEKTIDDLNKNKVKNERDSLHKQVERLTANLARLDQENQDKERQRIEDKQIRDEETRAKIEKEKYEVLANVVNGYKNEKFDDLIKSSNLLSVQRDKQLVGYDAETKQVLSDLEAYFYAEIMLANKIDVERIKNALTQLNEIKQQSELLDKLKKNVKYYEMFNYELKKTIGKIVKLDEDYKADEEPQFQVIKFNKILSELEDYKLNFYDYENYPYLSNIIIEIILRKCKNADADINDLLIKL